MLPTSDSKLLAKWQGPCEITRRLGPTTYEVSMPGRQRSKKILHVNLLKEWVPHDEKVPEVMLIQRIEEEEEVDDQHLPISATSHLVLDHLTEEQQSQVKPLINTKLFSESPGRTNVVEHTIVLKSDAPLKRMSYRIPECLLVALRRTWT